MVFLSSQKYDFPIEKVQNLDSIHLFRFAFWFFQKFLSLLSFFKGGAGQGGRGAAEKKWLSGAGVSFSKKKIGMGSPYNCIFSVLRKVKENKESIYWTNISMCPHDTTMSQFY